VVKGRRNFFSSQPNMTWRGPQNTMHLTPKHTPCAARGQAATQRVAAARATRHAASRPCWSRIERRRTYVHGGRRRRKAHAGEHGSAPILAREPGHVWRRPQLAACSKVVTVAAAPREPETLHLGLAGSLVRRLCPASSKLHVPACQSALSYGLRSHAWCTSLLPVPVWKQSIVWGDRCSKLHKNMIVVFGIFWCAKRNENFFCYFPRQHTQNIWFALLVSTSCKVKASSFGWWLMAGAGLFWEKSTAVWLLVADLFWEKSTFGWWLMSSEQGVN
jgi:hypothetical protein